MNDPAQFWADPRLVYAVAILAVVLLMAAIWLFQRRKRQGRQAGMVCLVLAILMHAALILLVPMLPVFNAGRASVDLPTQDDPGVDAVSFSTFDPDLKFADASAATEVPAIAPLPVSDLMDPVDIPAQEPENAIEQQPPSESPTAEIPSVLVADPAANAALEEMLDDVFDLAGSEFAELESTTNARQNEQPAASSPTPKTTVAGQLENDFANRTGTAKQQAITSTGGDADTEAAVEAALQFLATSQRPDGAWDPLASGAGVERSPLGLNRGGAGGKAESAITGLALLSLLGAGHTHQQGGYRDNVFRGLVHLMRVQKPDGSLSGDASVYATTYSHGMAALAVCEAAALTHDPAAIQSARRAIAYTRRMQHPVTGGWRYLQGDPGDLSQLGWQAMLLDAGLRADLPIDRRSIDGVKLFLNSVRMGNHGGLACYRPGERASPTMTAEALATRLLMGQAVPVAEIAEAEQFLLQNLPGIGKDNYYYWYYATLALHQLQDEAWETWNQALKRRLLETQRPDGSWSSDTLWGGYGGTVYTTSMATLCLETYYRHAIRDDRDRLANQPDPQPDRR